MFVMKYRAFVMKYLFDVLFETLVRFVTCIAFVWNPELPQKYLMSGSGDSTVSYHVSLKPALLRLLAIDVEIFLRFDCGMLHLGLFLTHVKLVQW